MQPKKIYFFFTVLFLFVISCNQEKSEINLETIVIDKDQLQNRVDGGFLIDTVNYEIVALETSEASMIGRVAKTRLRGDKIIIYDDLQRAVFVFNRDGSFHAKVHAIGKGPGEYTHINDMVITRNYIAALAPHARKILFYDFDGKYVKEIPMNRDVWSDTFFTFDEEEYYLVNDLGEVAPIGGKYLYVIDSTGQTIKSFFPFGHQSVNSGWGLANYYARYNKHALVIYSKKDTIYQVKSTGEVLPRYYADIVKYKLPEGIAEGEGRRALEISFSEGYITGVSKIMETSRYIVLELGGAKRFFVVYDKNTQMVKATSEWFIFPQWDNLTVDMGEGNDIENDRFLYVMPTHETMFDKQHLNKTEYGDRVFLKKYKAVLDDVKSSEDNPLVFIFNINK
jgi:hypothetical protein